MDTTFIHSSPDAAAGSSGALAGINIAIQPNISVKGWPTEAGSKALINFTALEDAAVVQRLRKAGAALCGSTRMSEFGFGLAGSRAGEALREGAADVELVLDLMGESRLAAARAGVCGFKPSCGLVSRLGLVGLIPSMESWGLLSASISAIRNTAGIIAGPDPLDFTLPDESAPDFSAQEIDRNRIILGVIAETLEGLPADRQKAFRSEIDELKQAGFSIRELSLSDYSLFSLVHNIVGSVEASSCAGRYDSVRYGQRESGARNWNEMYLLSRGAAFGTLVKSLLFQGAFFQFERYEAYENACRIRARLAAEMERLCAKADFLLLPAADSDAAFGEAASLADTYDRFAGTLFANVTGQPALCLPPGGGKPGLQLAGPRLSDARLLALGEYLLNLRQGGNA